MMKTRKVDILCVLDTKWKGGKAKGIGKGFIMVNILSA